ncbi:MAG: hypothetical protein IPL55_11675 [Saprospiraceae bacterium]|jgi:hypothetical protein|nr:hypothetical protein [Saprospiraceae bacterium]MBL0024474.1 hypothetical protein [Saprospiraceae bacterium]
MTKLYNYLVKDGDAIAVGFSALMFILFAASVYFGAQSGGYDLSSLTDMQDKSNVNIFNLGLYIVMILGAIAVFLMLFGIFWDLIKNFKTGSKTIMGFGAIVVAFVIFYFTSSHDSGGRFDAYWSTDPFNITVGLSKFISAGLYTLMSLTLLSFLLILFFEIRSFFK